MAAILLGEPAVTAGESLLERLRLTGICVPRSAEVRDYVRQYPDIINVVHRACDAAAAEFAGNAALSLELYVDPEIDDPHLMLYVRPEPFDPSVWESIERVRDLYADELADQTGWLHVGVDFRAPERR
jgi:hypothetical protein